MNLFVESSIISFSLALIQYWSKLAILNRTSHSRVSFDALSLFLIIIMAVYILSSPKTNIDSTYVKIYYFNFFLIIRKNFAFFFSKFNLGEWLLRTFAEVITQFIHATTRTFNFCALPTLATGAKTGFHNTWKISFQYI